MVKQTPRAMPVKRAAKGSRGKTAGAISLCEGLKAFMAALGDSPERRRLVSLWQQWPHVLSRVLSPELAETVCPLGVRRRRGEKIILLGCADNCLLQEIHYHIPEIVSCLNEYMAADYFAGALCCLSLGRRSLFHKKSLADQPPTQGSRTEL